MASLSRPVDYECELLTTTSANTETTLSVLVINSYKKKKGKNEREEPPTRMPFGHGGYSYMA